MKTWLGQLTRYIPEAIEISFREQARSLVGAALGIFLTGLCSRFVIGTEADYPWLVAPIGASALLLFTVPSSPLAQPWSLIGGNIISALVGIGCAKMITVPVAAASIAVAAAMAAMFLLRCLHPPGAALALGAALGGPGLAERACQLVLAPVIVNTTILLATAIVYNKMCGRHYPRLAGDYRKHHRSADIARTTRAGFVPADIDFALKQHRQALDISRSDVEELLLHTEMHAFQPQFGELRCADIMTTVKTAGSNQPVAGLVSLFLETGLHHLPVIDANQRLVGMVSQSDLIAALYRSHYKQ